MIRHIRVATLWLMVGCQFALAEAGELTAGADSEQSDHGVREMIERGLPFIEREGLRWMEEKKCDSCHQVPFMVWSLNAAADRGFKVEPTKLEQWNQWAREWQNIRGQNQAKEGEKEKTLLGSADELGQLLLGARKVGSEATAVDEKTWRTAYREYLLRQQLDDGSWRPGGQLPSQKRPLRETQEVTTMWSLFAISSDAAPSHTELAVIDKGTKWLGDATRGESTEWWSVRLLWEHSQGNVHAATRFRDELLEHQRADGGWGWLAADDSDALGTGQALYALVRTGLPREHTAVRGAQQFLRKTQQADGAWPVRGTKSNKKDQFQATATYWGTCWAVIGLAEGLPCAPSN